MPFWPLAATLAVQTLATMALFSVPAAAPAIAHDLGVSGELSGAFVSIVYGVGIISAVLAPGFVHRYGAVRVSQIVLLAVLGLIGLSSTGTLAGLAAGAIVLGLTYGAIAPASTHLLVPQTPPAVFNLVMSLRQIGVPLGGVLGALIVPPIAAAWSWRLAMAVQAIPVFLLLLGMERPRLRWDSHRNPTHPLWTGILRRQFELLRHNGLMRRLSTASFVYSGAQLCFIAFMTVQLTAIVHLSLVRAGYALAIYQVSGAIARPIWGWIADCYISPFRAVAALGFGMAGCAIAASQLSPAWSFPAVLLLAVLSGSTATGFTGLAYAEYARLGGARRTEATGLGTAVMFAGVMLLPSTFGGLVSALDGYGIAYLILAALVVVSSVPLIGVRPR